MYDQNACGINIYIYNILWHYFEDINNIIFVILIYRDKLRMLII